MSTKRKKGIMDLRQFGQLLGGLLQSRGARDAGERSATDAAGRVSGLEVPLAPVALNAAAPPVSGVFEFLEKKSEQRIFFSYLYRFELTRSHLGSGVARQLLHEIRGQSGDVSQHLNETAAAVSQAVISAAAWSTIYCLLGPARMTEMAPEYRDIIDEVEMELLVSCAEDARGDSIYRRVYYVLSANALCHPEVLALVEACADAASGDPPSGTFHPA